MTVGSVAAAPVAGGPGVGARRARADAQGAARVAPARPIRRRRRPCARRPSAAGSGDPRSRVSPCAGPRRPRPRRRRRRCRPCRARSRRRRPAAREQRGADRAPGRAREDAPGAGPRGFGGRRRSPPEDCITSGSGSPARRAASARRSGSGRAAARGRRRSRWSSSARTPGRRAGPRARPRRARPAAPRAARSASAARGSGRGRRRAGRPRRTRLRRAQLATSRSTSASVSGSITRRARSARRPRTGAPRRPAARAGAQRW